MNADCRVMIDDFRLKSTKDEGENWSSAACGAPGTCRLQRSPLVVILGPALKEFRVVSGSPEMPKQVRHDNPS
jgi:hypothetical protein